MGHKKHESQKGKYTGKERTLWSHNGKRIREKEKSHSYKGVTVLVLVIFIGAVLCFSTFKMRKTENGVIQKVGMLDARAAAVIIQQQEDSSTASMVPIDVESKDTKSQSDNVGGIGTEATNEHAKETDNGGETTEIEDTNDMENVPDFNNDEIAHEDDTRWYYDSIVTVFNELTEEEQETIRRKMSAYGPKEEYIMNVSELARKYMEWITFNESRGEPFKGQVAVAATILNRFMSKAYTGMSIEEICKQRSQYAFAQVSEEELAKTTVKEAVDQALRGYDPTREVFTNGARFFYNPEYTAPDELAKRQGILEMVIGNHHFHNDFTT